MDPSNTQGPGSFSRILFHICWDIVGSNVITEVQKFFKDGYLLFGSHSKRYKLSSISQYRPTAFTNFFFKIITNVLATWLNFFIDKIIYPNQEAFIRGPSIHKCIVLVLEGINILARKSFGSNIVLKLYILEAIDTLNSNFLLLVLKSLGFHLNFVHQVSLILTWV